MNTTLDEVHANEMKAATRAASIEITHMAHEIKKPIVLPM